MAKRKTLEEKITTCLSRGVRMTPAQIARRIKAKRTSVTSQLSRMYWDNAVERDWNSRALYFVNSPNP